MNLKYQKSSGGFLPEARKEGRHFYVKGVLDPENEYSYRYPDIPLPLYNGVDSDNLVEMMTNELKEYDDVEVYGRYYTYMNTVTGYISISWDVGNKFMYITRQIYQLEICVL